jgi:hypothetical protein
MSYSKHRTGLTQEQSVENLRAVLGSDYFKQYVWRDARFSSNFCSLELNGSYNPARLLTVKKIGRSFASLLEQACKGGILSEVRMNIVTSEEMTRAMKFQEPVCDEGLSLPLHLNISKEGTTEDTSYRFEIINLGLKQSYFESQGWDFKDAQARLGRWYTTLTCNLKKILPHEVHNGY